MSSAVASVNRFAFLDEDGDESPKLAPAVVKKEAVSAQPATTQTKPAARPQRGDYPNRGAPRRVYQGDREINTDATAGIEGLDSKAERAATFGGRGGARGTRGGRGRGGGRSNGGSYLGGDRPRRDQGGGRPFDRMSQTGHKDSEKAEEKGWGAEDGKSELQAEVEGEADAQKEQKEVSTATTPGNATPIAEKSAPVEEEEDNTQTYEEYLASKASSKLNISLPEARSANEGADDSKWKDAVALAKKGEGDEEWLTGAKKADAAKARKQKEKTFIDIDPTFRPPRRDGPPRDGARGGRGGRGRGDGTRGNFRGDFRGRGRGQANSGPAPVNVDDAKAFPSLA